MNIPMANSQQPAADASVDATSAAKISPYVVELDDAAKFLCIRRAKLYQLIKSRAIASRKIGARRVVLVESLIRYINEAPQD